MSITTMTTQEKNVAQNNTTPETTDAKSETKTEVAHWLNKKDDTTFSEFIFDY